MTRFRREEERGRKWRDLAGEEENFDRGRRRRTVGKGDRADNERPKMARRKIFVDDVPTSRILRYLYVSNRSLLRFFLYRQFTARNCRNEIFTFFFPSFFSFFFFLPPLVRKKIGRRSLDERATNVARFNFLIFDLKLIIVPNDEMNGILIVDNCLG